VGENAVVEWVLEGDPAIRWQVLRDLALLRDRRTANGRWPLQKRIPVEMEKPGGESRWNTLRALRVLRRLDAVQRQPVRATATVIV
jgi:hypothetical protein